MTPTTTDITPSTTQALTVLQVAQIPLDDDTPRWMINPLWAATAVGFIGGPPKCCKSYLGLEMAISVASNTPCLGCYPTLEPGPALVYLAEDALPAVRERVAGLARHRGLDLDKLPLHVITEPRLRLDHAADLDRLFETTRRLRPRLLLLDPLVRLHQIDENNANDVARLLASFRELQRRYNVAIALVHHTRKSIPAGSQAGLALRGSTDLHAFGDSNLYLRRLRGRLTVTMEHRNAAAPDPIGIDLVTTDPQAIHLRVVDPAAPETPHHHDSLDRRVLQTLADRPPMTRQALRQQLAVKNATLGDALQRLEARGDIKYARDGWQAAP